MLLQSLATSFLVASAMCLPSFGNVRASNASKPAGSVASVVSASSAATAGPVNITGSANVTAARSTLSPNVTVVKTTAVQPSVTSVAPGGGYTSIVNHTTIKNYTITKKPEPTTYTAIVSGTPVYTCPVCERKNGTTIARTETANHTVTYTAVVGGVTKTKTVSGKTITTCEGGVTIHTCPVCEAAAHKTKSPKVTYTAVLGGTTKTKTISGETITTCAGGVTVETCPVCEGERTAKPTAIPSHYPNLTFSAVVGGTTKTKTVGGQPITSCEGGTTLETCFHCASIRITPTATGTTRATAHATASATNHTTVTAVKPTCSPLPYFKPQVLIINAFGPEETQWIKKLQLTQNITVPLLSPLYPHVHSNKNFTIMSVTTGEAESNAAASITALLSSSLFDFSETYFLVSGIAGGSPVDTSIGSVTFPHFAVQIGSAYELDAREVPQNWTYSYVNYGDEVPNKYPSEWYGTEVFELNEKLVDRAVSLAKNVSLTNLTSGLGEFVKKYNTSYAAAKGPKVVACDTATSDVYWKGFRLAQWAEDTVKTFTNGTAKYCSTQQEDNASLEAILRAAKFGLADFDRVVISRGISDFDRPFPGANVTEYAFNGTYVYANQSEKVALDNLYKAGLPFVQDVVNNWDSLYKINHFSPKNYTGDYFETLGGKKNF